MSSLFLCSICHSVSVICECIQVTVLSVCMSVCHGWWALMHYWMSHVSLFVVYQLDLLSLNEWAVISLTLILVCHPIMSFVCIHVLIVYSSCALWDLGSSCFIVRYTMSCSLKYYFNCKPFQSNWRHTVIHFPLNYKTIIKRILKRYACFKWYNWASSLPSNQPLA